MRYRFHCIFPIGTILFLTVAACMGEEGVAPAVVPEPAAVVAPKPEARATNEDGEVKGQPVESKLEGPAASAKVESAPVNPDAPKITVGYPDSTNTIQLTEEQAKKLREMIARQKVSAEKKKKEKEMLDRTPVLDHTYNPNITERRSIPNRF